MQAWLTHHETWLLWLGGLSLVSVIASLVVTALILVRMPADYFLHASPAPGTWRERYPLLRLVVVAFKNLLGIGLLLAGAAMLVLPGQGLLTLLIGLSLLGFPGKRRLELWLLRRRGIHRAIAWIRSRAGQPALRLPPEPEAGADAP